MKIPAMVILCCVLSAPSFGQSYMPIGKQKKQSVNKHGFLANSTILQCAQSDIPTWAVLKTKKFDSHLQIMSASQAASLNISFIGSGSISYNGDQLLAVSDSSRVAPCLATDGKTTLYYGEVIRTVVKMNDYTVKGSASFAVVAATATAEGKSNSVDLYEVGFGDTQLDAKLTAAKQTLGGSGINIENYSDFIKAYDAAETYALTITNPGIDLVASSVTLEGTNYPDMLAIAWAIQRIAQGSTCDEAKKDFKAKNPQYQEDIDNAYGSIAEGCVVDSVGKAKAQQLLNGLKIRY